MKIIDDKISLDPEDVAQFSKAAQRALATPDGNQTYKESAETAFNYMLSQAIEVWRKTVTVDSAISKLAEAVAVEVDPSKKAQAEALIDQAKEILDVKEEKGPAVGLNPTAEPAVPKTK